MWVFVATLGLESLGFEVPWGWNPQLRSWPYFSLQRCVMAVAQKPRIQSTQGVVNNKVTILIRTKTKASLRQLLERGMYEDKETMGPKPRPRSSKTWIPAMDHVLMLYIVDI
jgi:hypothetical protein